ncbi:MAG: hypothetical protein HQL22_10835 [Candidatus Omnitrophica bacterium]|nr:hypothetical protein [Candidatus Omnitrophota bacterium]
MEQFRQLFGIDQGSVQPNCLLLPFLPPGALAVLGISKLSRGSVFSSASIKGLTIILTGIGAGFVGDAVLYLNQTPCQNIFFVGSCGLINNEKGLKVGDLVLPSVAFSIESFSDILNDRIQEPVTVSPDLALHSYFLKTMTISIDTGACVSFGSLHEEERFVPLFRKLHADVIDMECAAFFLAAHKTNKKALALIFISDILLKIRFFETMSPENKKRLSAGAEQAVAAIKNFIETYQDGSIKIG